MTVAAQPWWVIAITEFGHAPQYVYFQGTQAQADAKAKTYVEVSTSPAVTGPFKTRADAQASVKAGKANTPKTGDSGPPIPTLGNPLTGINAIGDFFSRLTQASTWIRVAKVVVGAALVVIGLAHMTGAGNAVATAARKVPLPV